MDIPVGPMHFGPKRWKQRTLLPFYLMLLWLTVIVSYSVVRSELFSNGSQVLFLYRSFRLRWKNISWERNSHWEKSSSCFSFCCTGVALFVCFGKENLWWSRKSLLAQDLIVGWGLKELTVCGFCRYILLIDSGINAFHVQGQYVCKSVATFSDLYWLESVWLWGLEFKTPSKFSWAGCVGRESVA